MVHAECEQTKYIIFEIFPSSQCFSPTTFHCSRAKLKQKNLRKQNNCDGQKLNLSNECFYFIFIFKMCENRETSGNVNDKIVSAIKSVTRWGKLNLQFSLGIKKAANEQRNERPT